jgi:hypothetical protein
MRPRLRRSAAILALFCWWVEIPVRAARLDDSAPSSESSIRDTETLGRTTAAASDDAAQAVGRGGVPKARKNPGWFVRVSHTQGEQPHWITPLVTVTPRLEEEYRFDLFRQVQSNGNTATFYGAGKGLELIPAERVEVIVGAPSYVAHHQPGARDGFGDLSFLVKYRLLSSNEEHGNGIVTLFFGASVPTATHNNGPGHAIFTPTVAAGKGWGHFDVQSTLGVGLPSGARNVLGTPVTSNAAFQYHLAKKLWPELELNSTWWPNGQKSGKKQVFLTPGLVVGRLPLWRRLGLTVGAGVQIAVTDYRAYDHNWILTVRLPF